MTIREQLTLATSTAAGLGAAALAIILSLKSPDGDLVLQCYPEGGDCALVFEASPEQCPALLRNGGNNTGPVVPEDTDIALGAPGYRKDTDDEVLGVALVDMMQADVIQSFITERRLDENKNDLPCVVTVFLSRAQADALQAGLSGEGEQPVLVDAADGILFGEQMPQGGVVLAGQPDVVERREYRTLHLGEP